MFYQIFNLLNSPAARRIRYCPGHFFARLKLGFHTNLNEGREDIGIDDRLNLFTISGRDIRNGPRSLFANRFLFRTEESKYARQSIAVEDDLGLCVVTGDNIADCSQGRRNDIVQVVAEREMKLKFILL